jgi:Big-like domain-containing protein/VCBS repeat protein/FG-GAP repeat protein
MIRHFVCKFHSLVIVALFAAIIMPLALLAAPAQQTRTRPTTAKSAAVFVPHYAGAPDSGTVSFFPAVTYGAGSIAPFVSPGSLVAVDVNGDGKPDLIVANTAIYDGSVSSVGVLLGNGDGTFQPAVVNTSLDRVGEFNALAVVDVNRDGNPDLIVAACCESNGDEKAAVLLGNGDGTFQSAVNYDAGGRPTSSLAVDDVNGDGRPDIVMVNWNRGVPSTTNVLLGNGDGTFQSPLSSEATIDPGCATIADVNRDGKPDLLICSEDTVTVLLGNGDGTFRSFTNNNFYAGFCDSAVVVTDVNADGLPDMVVPNATPTGGGFGCSSQGFAGILLGNGDGTFQAEVNYLALSNINIGVGPGTVSDVNGDGKPDVMITSGLGLYGSVHGSVGVLLGNGNGTFQTATSFDTGGPQAYAVVATDLNGDAKPDIVVANFGSSTLGVLLNSTTSGTIPTTTALVSSARHQQIFRPVTYTATVTSQTAQPVTGTVAFHDNGTTVATVTVSGNIAIYHTSYSTPGTHLIVATYSGDANNSGSTSPVLTEIIGPGKPPFPTTTDLSISGSGLVGQPVTFTATVSSLYGTIPDGDTVKFFVGNRTVGTGTLVGGVTSLTTSLSAGRHNIQAFYLGDPTFKQSFVVKKYVVSKYSTTTTLVSSLNPAVYGQPVTYTVTVTSTGPAIPTGNVRLTDIGLVPLVGGVATITKDKVRVGTHAITAEYLADDVSEKSISPVLEEVVTPAATTTTIVSSVNPSSSGQTVIFTATVTSSTGLDPFGNVTFTAGAVTLGTVAVINTKASISTASLPVGSTTITATYNGAAGFTGSSASLTQEVHP